MECILPDLVAQMLSGSRYALARLVSLIENRPPDVLQVMAQVHPHVRGIPTIGITGPPGAGKSTFVDKLITRYRSLGQRVAVVAVDPSSPFSGGAVLGDRVRMHAHALDEGVFIRSLSSRGHFGGLTISTGEVVKLFDAAGFDRVIIETVGVGQTEFSVMEVADTVVVMVVPESGDTIQTMKAGLLEVADLFVVNKADRDGADKIQRELKNMLQLSAPAGDWQVPVLMTTSHRGLGIDDVLEGIGAHEAMLADRGAEGHADLRAKNFKDIVVDELVSRLAVVLLRDDGPLSDLLHSIRVGEKNPYSAALSVLDDHTLTQSLIAEAARCGRSG